VNTRFALSMARRELRASRRRFALYGGCMALGIAALVALQGLRETVRGAVAAESRSLLGADLRLESRTPFDEATLALLERLHEGPEETTGRITRFASMALVPRSGRTRLVDVQAVGGTFPLHGEVRTDPPEAWPRLRGEELVAVVDRSLLVQLEAEVGDALALGEARFEIAGSIVRAPGTFGMRTRVAPRVFIARRAVEETGLVRPGSLVEHLLYARADEARLRPWLDRHRERLLAARVRVQTVAGYEESLSRSFGTLSRYLGLVGLAALALGGVGVAAGARVFVREKLDTVAVLRALGARSNDVLAAYGLLALALGAVAGTAGAAIGAVLQWVLPWLLRAFLPVEVEVSLEPGAVATGIGLGVWLTLLFAGGPLLDLGRVPPLRALRRDFTAGRAALTGRVLLVGAVALTLLAASLWQAPRPALGLAFAGGLAGAIALLAAAAGVTMRALRRHPLRRAPFWLRQGVANLFRPRNHTLASVLAVGFGLFVVATLQIVRHNVLAQIASDTSPDRPNLVLFDVQRDQLDAVRALAEERGARLVEQAPIVSLRIARLAGREVSEQLRAEAMSRDLRWALRREYRATYSGELRETETISSGRWWSPDDLGGNAPAGVSLETEIAALLGVAPGDSIAWDVQGVRLDSVVRSLRDVNWDRLATNFFLIFSPGVLEEAPQSLVLLLRLPGADARAAFQRDLVGRFANVSALDATVILAAVDSLLGELGFAVRLLALFTLATGLSVLVAAGASARHERTREALLLRTLGASSRTVRRIVACEALALAAIAAAVGAGLALAASWALVRFVFELPFGAPLGELAALSLGTVAATAALGAASGGTRRARSPLAALREAELSGATALLLLALA
jgi:putative ABC transport system permease protein